MRLQLTIQFTTHYISGESRQNPSGTWAATVACQGCGCKQAPCAAVPYPSGIVDYDDGGAHAGPANPH